MINSRKNCSFIITVLCNQLDGNPAKKDFYQILEIYMYIELIINLVLVISYLYDDIEQFKYI